MDFLFPHDLIRSEQAKLAQAAYEQIKASSSLVAHAPTGIGKTAATLGPAITIALEQDLTILYLTSRHTQHHIVLETVSRLREKSGKDIRATSIIGKKWMCLQDGAETMPSADFFSYCKALREEKTCSYYTRTRGQNNELITQIAIRDIGIAAQADAQTIINVSQTHALCPYEVGLMLAEKAHVIVMDYFYLFQPSIRESFLKKINKQLDKIILIVDEAHNLPSRLRDMQTKKITSRMIRTAISEAEKYGLRDLVPSLRELEKIIEKSAPKNGERLLERDTFIAAVSNIKEYEEFASELMFAGEMVLAKQRQSRLSWISSFLEAWPTTQAGMARIISTELNTASITLRCLDPSSLSQDILNRTHSVILMSGTLTPPQMYAELLGVPPGLVEEYKSPFEQSKRLPIIIPKTTTKFTSRNIAQYKNIAALCAQVANTVPGNVLVFFPSYHLRDAVNPYFVEWYEHSVFLEQAGLTGEAKEDILKRFSCYKDRGAALLAVSAGSFGEGVDLPGILKGVIVVGLPLDRPDLETQELIKYYDTKLGKGWQYGYIQPAMNKTFQNAGRCIRTETDYGILAFIDERYAWQQYKSCFPKHWNVHVSENYMTDIANFFASQKNGN